MPPPLAKPLPTLRKPPRKPSLRPSNRPGLKGADSGRTTRSARFR
jgi:hypothetical protein